MWLVGGKGGQRANSSSQMIGTQRAVTSPAGWIQSNQQVLGQLFRCSGLGEPSHPRQVGFNRTYKTWVCVRGQMGAVSWTYNFPPDGLQCQISCIKKADRKLVDRVQVGPSPSRENIEGGRGGWVRV